MKYVDDKFDAANINIEDLLSILYQLGEILNRPSMHDWILTKYKKLIDMFYSFLVNTQKMFKDNKNTPPIEPGYTEFGGKLSWSEILRNHCKELYN